MQIKVTFNAKAIPGMTEAEREQITERCAMSFVRSRAAATGISVSQAISDFEAMSEIEQTAVVFYTVARIARG